MNADARSDDAIPALPPGTRFGELEILGTLGMGGFGIVYLARDHSLEREVAIKEYMPSQFASRDGQSHVSVRSVSMRETFELGRRSFVNEARLLARFDHPSLLKVYRFWEANGTAYMAMPRLVGQNLREARKSRPTPPPEAWVRRIFDSVLGGLETLHAQQVWHRDVAPDNIFMPADGGPPILLDFGAARQAIGDKTQAFTAILKPSFAPIEQYAEADTLRQGAWTDFYALAAAMHELLTGRPPPPATTRAMVDDFGPIAVDGYSPAFLAGLDWALRVPPHQRPQTAAAWRAVLDGREPVPEPLPAPPRTGATQPPPRRPSPMVDLDFPDSPHTGAPGGSTSFDATVVVPMSSQAATGAYAPTTVSPRVPPAPPPPPEPPPAVPTPPAPVPPAPVASPAAPAVATAPPRRTGLIVAAVLAALVLLGLFVVQLGGGPAKPEVVVPPEPQASAPAAVAEPASVPASMPTVIPPMAASAPAPAKPVPAPMAATSAPVRSAAPASAPARRDGTLRPIASAPDGARPVDTRPAARNTASAPVDSASRAVAPPASAAAAAPPEAASPGEACGGRVLFARAWCVDRQCEKPVFRNHPECVKLRELRNSQGGVP